MVLEGDELHGMIFFHQGDESGFVARRVKAQKRPRREWPCHRRRRS
jgi:hypothetical protein